MRDSKHEQLWMSDLWPKHGCVFFDFIFYRDEMPITFKFNKGWSRTMEEVSWTKSEPHLSNAMPYNFEFWKLAFYPCISHRAPNPNLRGTHKREDSDDRLTPQGWGKCMSKPKLTVFQTCPVILSILKLEDHVSLLIISVFGTSRNQNSIQDTVPGSWFLLWHFWGLFPSLHACLVDLVWGWDYESDVEVLGGSSHLLRGYIIMFRKSPK